MRINSHLRVNFQPLSRPKYHGRNGVGIGYHLALRHVGKQHIGFIFHHGVALAAKLLKFRAIEYLDQPS